MFFQRIRDTLELVKFSHSIFALPFALSALFFAADGFPGWRNFLLIVAAMVLARNVAMSFNRFIDAEIDAKNPRTASRHLPQKILSRRYVALFTLVNSAGFIAVASLFNRLTLILSPIALVILCLYSTTKRWTRFTQLFLGLALGISPAAVWIAVTGGLETFPLLMGLGVLFWVAGFDLLYATQDYEFDRVNNLGSITAWLGIPKAFLLSKILHGAALVSFLSLGILYGVKGWFLLAVAAVAALLVYEHSLVKPGNLSRLDAAFFTTNGVISLLFLAGTLLQTLR